MSSPSDEAPAPARTRSPFFCDPKADVILVSSDQVEFHLHQLVLSLVSPVFRDMFSLPQGEIAESSSDGLPEVQISESSAVLQRFLRFWYPGADLAAIPFTTISELAEVLELIVLKYDIHTLIPVSKMQLERLSVADPLAGFPVAVRYGWKDIALKAAKESLRVDLRTAAYSMHRLQWTQVPATALLALLEYHQRCSEAVTTVGIGNFMLQKASTPGLEFCTSGRRQNKDKVPGRLAWWDTAVRELVKRYERFQLPRADYKVVFAEIFKRTYNGCPECINVNYEVASATISGQWWTKIDAKIDAIELDL
ncbi:hypothetical protein C8F01DRAFT_1021140 [Mycena amicta]|nr:hypothetical protein C8F01DRAFT_1021140 [Mycena amicta]